MRADLMKRAARLRVYRLLDRPVWIELAEGVNLYLDPKEEIAPLIYKDYYERREREFVRRLLRPGDVVYDVGAHIGLYTITAARRIGPSGCVHAFEPNPASFALLARSIERAGLGATVRCHRLALGDHSGTASLKIPDEHHGAWASFGAPTLGGVDGESIVTVSTLDEQTAEAPSPFFLKVDVEGWESRVLAGGTRTLSGESAPHLMVEFTDAAAANAGTSTAALYAQLCDLGYVLYRYRGGELLPETAHGDYPYDNLVATKRDEELRRRLGLRA